MTTIESSPRGSLLLPDSPARRHEPPPPRAAVSAPRWHALAVTALLALYAVCSWTASLTKGLSFDEGVQLSVGYHLWLNDDYRVEGANGDFIKRWATLPYLVSRPAFLPPDDPLRQTPDSYAMGHRFFFELGNRPEALLWQARAMVALLGIAAGLFVYREARRLFGPAGGLVSLAIFATSPHMLAFGGVVSTDMSITFALFGATLCIWRLLHDITWPRVLGSAALFAILLLAKMTAVVIFPITAAMIAVRFVVSGPLAIHWRGSTRMIHSRRSLAAIVGLLVVFHAIVGWAGIWAHYGFRYAADPKGNASVQAEQPVYRDGEPGRFAKLVRWSAAARLFPEGYCRGIDWLLGTNNKQPAFMAGEAKLGGWRMFFPYAIWVKSRPTLFLLLMLGAWAAGQARTRHRALRRETPPHERSRLYEATPHFALVVAYLAIAVAQDFNIGHRHVLPIYPSLHVLAGAVVLAGGRWRVPARVATAALLAWGLGESIAARPHYLAYFGSQAGGPEHGHSHLVDSSLDWGMNLPGLKRWLDRHNGDGRERVFLAYFGNDDPGYHGIEAQRLPGYYDRRDSRPYALTPGYYAISATLFEGAYLVAFGRWNAVYESLYQTKLKHVRMFEASAGDPARRAELLAQKPAQFWFEQYTFYDHLRFARLCAWLRQQGPPPHHIGHAIFIWKLDLAALEAALLGPPVEMAEAPPEWQRLVGRQP